MKQQNRNPIPPRHMHVLAVAVSLVGNTLACAPSPATDATPVPAQGDDDVTSLLQPILREHDVPALAAALITSDGIVASGAIGYRKRGDDTPVSLDDHWHLGSNTKAMTATLAARLIESGELAWDTTVAEVFPDLDTTLDPKMKRVTLRHLLSHRAGLPENLTLILYRGDDVRDLRLKALRNYLALPHQSEPGSTYSYSNLGYIIAGAMIERITDKAWEENLQEHVFEPLGMKNTGFGGLGTPGKLDQPWGHLDSGSPVAGNGPEVDNPPVMGPAGRVHGTIQDWALFIRDQLAGAQGEAGLLEPDSYVAVQTPWPGGEYALGWIVVERSWAGGKAMNHGGSNTMYFSNVWLAPQRDFAILACTNQGGDDAFKATDAAIVALINLHERLRE